MIWSERPSADTMRTAELPRVPGTIPNYVALAEYDALSEPVKHRTSHRKPPRAVLTWGQTGAAASVLGAGLFVAFLMSAGSGSPAPATSHQAAPEAATVLSPSPTKAKVKRPSVRRAEPVVLRSAPPARVAVPRITITVTAKPAPKPPTPSPTKSVKPSPTPSATPVIPETTDPEPTPDAPEAETTDTETPDDDA
jgi:hypothetical protein